jgi:PAS domain S-box-containing protein
MLESLLDSITDIVFFKDASGIYLGCNPAFAEFVGRPRDQIIGKTDHDLFEKSIADLFREHDQNMLKTHTSRHNEEWVVYPDGRKSLLDTLKTPFCGADGAEIGVLGVSRDITERKQAEDSLRDSETNFRIFFETIEDLILVTTYEGRILFSNQALHRKLGYSETDLASMTVLDLHATTDRLEAEAIFSAMLRGDQASCPLPLIAKNGSSLPVETRVWLGKWDGLDCIFGISKDLSTEQEAQQRFERLFRNNPSPMALSSLPAREFVDVNDAFLRLLGYSRSDVLGQTAEALNLFVQPEHQESVQNRLVSDSRITDQELQVRCRNGMIADGLFSGEMIENQGKRYLLTVMIDITLRKKAELEVARLSHIQNVLMRLATEFVNVPSEQQDDAINQSLSTMGRLIQADRAYLFSYDFNAGTMSNTHEWCNTGVSAEITHLQNVPTVSFPEWVGSHQRGELIYVPCVAALTPDDPLKHILDSQGIQSLITLPLMQGAICLGYVGFDAVREARVWKNDEIALLRVLAELYAHFETRRASERAMLKLQNRLTDARDLAQEAAVTKSLFLANMSHEIRTPLNAILGYAQILGRECHACPSARHNIQGILKSSEHLLELINDVLELSRSDGKKITLSPVPFDLAQLLEDVRLMFARRPDVMALKLEVRQATDVPRMLQADPGKIRQVLVNLMGNAVKFTHQGGVSLSASLVATDPAKGVVIAVDVEDTGCGIREEDQSVIFELFARLEKGKKPTSGIGLGLPLCRRYAHALGGDITVESRIGVGSRFRFTFTAEAVSDNTPELPAGHLHLAPDQREYHILAVDDDITNSEMLATLLHLVGFVVETLPDAAQALLRLTDTTRPAVDLVLMDKQMPGIDGYEAVRRIRALPNGNQIQVIIVTASGFTDERGDALAAGANGYVAKPIRLNPLLDEITRLVGARFSSAPHPGPTPVTFSPEVLRCLSSNQRPEILKALRYGDIRSLRALADQVGIDHAAAASTIRACIEAYDYDALRQLLEATPEESE